jgi:hypothetical protein
MGRVTVEPDTITVTGTDTEFPQDLVGSVIRFGTSGDDPDPKAGTSPFVRERYIASRLGDTGLTVTEPLAARSDVRYSISDPIDASPTMYTAILSACEMWYARIAGKPAADAMQMYGRDLRIAMENDVISPLSGRPVTGPFPTARSAGWHSDLRADYT